jgi:hypothetical protein
MIKREAKKMRRWEDGKKSGSRERMNFFIVSG